MSFEATEFEFRHRFWLIAGIFCLGFSLLFVDRLNVSVALGLLIWGAKSPLLSPGIRAFFVLGTLICVLAALIRTWAGGYLRSSIIHDTALHSDRLVADGPFRHLRNPLYLGTILLAIGVGVLASRSGFLVLSIGMVLFTYRLIHHEEKNLLQSQGESYRRYFDSVPRLIPSIRARVPARGAKPNWLDGFTGELFIWAIAAAMAAFAVTEKVVYYWIVFGSGFAIYLLQYFVRSRKRPA
jgi:protein-S-isoprenylcysteine O-methyltransferase Ste14